MASITKHYGIAGPVPFEDVDVHSDNYRFVDPHRIRLRTGPPWFTGEAIRSLDTFFNLISMAAMSSDRPARAEALEALQRFSEPRETRLGMATEGFSGHGAAEDLGERIWVALTTDLEALLRVGVLKHLEHLPLFVEGVDKDITSDITTRIIFEALASFTQETVRKFPQFARSPHNLALVDRQVWEPSTLSWTSRRMQLPAPDGSPLLLIPKGWAGRSLLMSPTRFYETSLLSHVQDVRAAVLNGKVVKTPKEVLRKDSSLARGRETHLEVTLQAQTAGVDLVARFEAFVRERFEAGDDVAA